MITLIILLLSLSFYVDIVLTTSCGIEIIVSLLDDSTNGNCNVASSCNLRACISKLQGSIGSCILKTGTHRITYGPVGTSNGLSPNTFLKIISEGNTKAIIDGTYQSSNNRLIYINEPTATIHFDNIVITNFNLNGGGCDQSDNSGAIKVTQGNTYCYNNYHYHLLKF